MLSVTSGRDAMDEAKKQEKTVLFLEKDIQKLNWYKLLRRLTAWQQKRKKNLLLFNQ